MRRVLRFAVTVSLSMALSIQPPPTQFRCSLPVLKRHRSCLLHECDTHSVHRSVLPRFRQRAPGLLPLRGVGAEFDANYAAGGLPSLSLVRFMHDHTGNFVAAKWRSARGDPRVNTPDLMVADNDYAVDCYQKIANSIYAITL